MKVAALTIDYPGRRFIGSEVATHAMLHHLAMHGHEVEVFTTTPGDEPWQYEGIDVTPGVNAFLAAVPTADVVVTHIELGKKLKGLAKPLVGITHNARPEMLQRMSLAPWSLIVHNSQATADALTPARECPYLIVRPPVDWQRYITDRPDAEAITLVNVTGEKGSDTFYELAARMPDRKFLGVIGGWGAPDRRDLPNVEIVEHCDDMRSVYARTRLLLMPSEHESWGRVAVEAMTSGIPVLATDLPGPREAIGDGGRLIELDWWDEYERQIRLLDDPDTYAQLSAAASFRAHQLHGLRRDELAALLACMEALAVGERGPWLEDGLVRFLYRPSGRPRLVREGCPQHQRMRTLPDVWQEAS